MRALNASGRSAAALGLRDWKAKLEEKGNQGGGIPLRSALAVTVPGAAAGWVDVVEKFGSRTFKDGKLDQKLKEVLAPAIELAEEGFPVSEVSAFLVSLVLSFWN